MDQQLTQHSSASDLDKLVHNFECENQQCVKLIDKENQVIEACEKRITESKLNISRLQEKNTQLDEDTKRAHKQFTCNRDNCESLKKTLLVLKDHEEALMKKLEAIKETANQEQCQRDEILKHYVNIWEDYQAKYQRFPMAVELQKQKNNVNCLETQLQDKESQMHTLKSQIQQWNEEHSANLVGLNNFITSIVKLKLDTENIVRKIKCIVEEKDKIEEEIAMSEKKMESIVDTTASTEMVSESEVGVELNGIPVTGQEPKATATHESEESAWISMFSDKDDAIMSTNNFNRLKTNNVQSAGSMQISSNEYDLPVPPKQPQKSTSQMAPQLSVPHKTLPVSFSPHVAPQHCRNLLASQTLSPQVATSETRAEIRTSGGYLSPQIPRLQQPAPAAVRSDKSSSYFAQDLNNQAKKIDIQKGVISNMNQQRILHVNTPQNFRMPTAHSSQVNMTRSRIDQGPVYTSAQSVPILRPLTPRILQPNAMNQSNAISSRSQSSSAVQKKLPDIQLSKPNCQQNSQHVTSLQPNIPQFSQPTTPLQQTASSRMPANSMPKSVQNKGVIGGQKSPLQQSNISPVESPSSSQNSKIQSTPEAPETCNLTEKSSPFDLDKHQQKIKLLSKSPGPHSYSSRLMFNQDNVSNQKSLGLLTCKDNLFCAHCRQEYFGLDMLQTFTTWMKYLLVFLEKKAEKLTKLKSKWLNKYKLDLKEASSLMTATTDKDMELDSINMDNSENIKKRARNKVKSRGSQDVTKAEHWENENSSNDDPDFVPSGEKAAPNETLCNLEKREDSESQSKAEHWENENGSNDDPDFVQSGEKAVPNETLCHLEKREDIESQSKAEHWENENSSNDDPDFVPSGEKAAPNETLCNLEKREDSESQSKAEHWENENGSNDDPDFVPSGEKAAPNETLCHLEKREDIESQSKAEHWENENGSNDDPDFVQSGEKAAPNETLCNVEKREDIESQSKAEHWENENSSNDDPDFIPSSENSEDEMSDCIPVLSHVETMDVQAAPNETLCNVEKCEDSESPSEAEHWENENSSNDDPDFIPSSENSEDEMSDCILSHVETMDDQAAPNETLCNVEKREDSESQSKADHWETENDLNDDLDFIPSGEKAAPNETLCNEKREDSESQSEGQGNSVKKCIGVQPMAIQGLPAESQLKPEERLEDINYPDIFTKRYAKDANEQSVHKRTYDRRHSCYFCGKLKTNIQTHLEHAHRSCEEVKKMYELKTKIGEMEENGEKKNLLKTELHRLQTSIRNKGDNIHNSKVYASKKGEIVLGRRRESKDFDVSKYGPCPQCMEWIIFENVKKHMAFCPLRCQIGEASSEAGIEDFTKGSMILQSKIMKGQITSKPSKRLLKEVFPSMSRDEISDIAQNDTLIVALGDTWLMKNIGNKSRRKNFTSFRMRLAARYLLLLRECSGKKDATLAEFIQPTHFDNAVECAFKACQETEEEELKSPSTAIKLGYDLSRLASAKLGFCIKNNDDKGKLEATDFLRLIQMEWSIKVTKYARVLLDERHFNKAKSLPIPEDIVQLATFMVEKIEATDLSEPNPELFREVVVLTEARLLLYNRRRPGELESLSVDAYLRRPSLDETELTLRQGLTAFEKHLLESQDLVEIRGKTGRGVPLLIPKEAKRMLEFLSDSSIREKGGIKRGNTLMFANTGDSAVRAGDALSEVKVRLKLKQPSRILATNLRKHTATIAQVLSLNEQQMKYVCNHLGHTQKIHDQYYRQTSGLIERIDIAKIMLIQEHNLVSTYANKKLEEVQFEDIIDDIAEIPKNNANEETLESSEERLEGNEDFMQVDVDMADFLDEPGRKKRKVNNRVRWSEDEVQELRKYFVEYFNGKRGKTCPSRSECLLAVKLSEDNQGAIWRRGWETIKKKVNNMLRKQ